MDKGVTPMQNIVCLKWSYYYRITVSWNILLGFPGEANDDYLRQIDLIPSLSICSRRKPRANSGWSGSARTMRDPTITACG